MEAPNDCSSARTASHPRTRSIDSFACQRAERIPPKLRQHLIDVIQSAKRLAEDPQSAGNVSPEAIELAVEIQREAALATTLRGVTPSRILTRRSRGSCLGRWKLALLNKINLRLLGKQLDEIAETPYFRPALTAYLSQLREAVKTTP